MQAPWMASLLAALVVGEPLAVMRVLDLFSGLGGFSLGLERAGMRTVAFCEIDPYCRAVLAQRWPGVPIYPDVTRLTAADVRAIDVICGGFPCQDISEAGKGAGIDGERSGLWAQYARLIGELRPSYAIVENVAALLGRGLGRVLGDLAALGYDAEWEGIPASAVGAHHERDRIWIVAYPERLWRRQSCQALDTTQGPLGTQERQEGAPGVGPSGEAVPDANRTRHEGARRELPRWRPILTGDTLSGDWQWEVEPAVGRVANGVPHWSHRIKSLGNAVVSRIPEIIGRKILEAEGACR